MTDVNRGQGDRTADSGTFVAARDGTIAVILAMGISVLAGIWALSIDLGRAWNLGTEFQNAADAAALACASQLDGKPGAISRAILAATGGLVQNEQHFASDGEGADVVITADDITFLSSLSPRNVVFTDTAAAYCEVTAGNRPVNFSFAQLVSDISSVSPRATAVAELYTVRCKIPPILICNPEAPGDFDVAGRIGYGITLKSSTGGSLAAGNFGLLGLPTDTKSLLSTSQVRDAFARITPMVQCFGDYVTSKPGQATSVAKGINMRFDIFPNSTHQVPTGEPPVMDNANYMPGMNNVKGLKKDGAACSLNKQGWNKTDQPYEGAPPSDAMGFPRDACAYGGGTCDTYAGGEHIGDGKWDIDTYMAVNHPTLTAPYNAVAELDGTTGKSRFEVYQWELSDVANNLSEAPPEIAETVCHNLPPAQVSPDRRVMTIAVVDCSELKGTTYVKPNAWIDVFLTEPMGVYDGNNDLYAEVVGRANRNSGTIKQVVRLVE